MQERRGNSRRKMVLPVKISFDKDSALAYTMDITSNGARLGGVRISLDKGQTVTLTRNGRKANFRVAWVRNISPNELQAGIEALQDIPNFWGVDLSDTQRTKDFDAMMTLVSADKKS
jgi:hypothetical protein